MPSSTGPKPETICQLRESGFRVVTVKEEMRRNLIARIQSGADLFPGIIGFDDSVIPQLVHALLAGQDIILLGERGQAKSRLIRALVTLLDDEIPMIAGCEINDNPFNPICVPCLELVRESGDDTGIEWLPRERRYAEKLSTPDITVADLIGEIDPIKVAEGRYLSDETAIHFGLVPRTNRGIFSINELPDLAERIQVALFNLMEERDIQIKGFRVPLPIDVFLIASANPEDYTNRGRIVTPLKDRYGAQIRTHYPATQEDEIAIVEQEYARFDDTCERVRMPKYMKQVVTEFTALARRSPEIDQRSGVSLRVTIANYETLLSTAFARSLRLGEDTCPRASDLPGLFASTSGKIELETVEEGMEEKVIDNLLKRAVLNVFGRYFSASEFDEHLERFDEGLVVETGAEVKSAAYAGAAGELDGFGDLLRRIEHSDEPAAVASAVDFVLEGLHLNRKLNRDVIDGRNVYSR